jgi:nucleoside-diphosphate-sugar epimerase
MKIIITGANGMVGSEVVTQAIQNNAISSITLITRKPLSIKHSKVTNIIHSDFLKYENISQVFAENDACIWCLGISQMQVNEPTYIKITYDFTIAAATAMLKNNSNISFLFLSGAGADSNEKSKTLFARIKGKTENELMKMSFKKLYIVRPGGIRPMNGKENAAWFEKVLIPIYPIFEMIFPRQFIKSTELGTALLNIILKGSNQIIHENIDLQKLA